MKNLIILLALLIININVSNAQWEKINTPVTNALISISSPDNSVCWSSGEHGAVIRTTNGGLNWQSVGLGADTITNIFALDANIALVALMNGNTALVFRTTNGGTNWIQVFSQNYPYPYPYNCINSVWMTSTLNGFMMGDPVGGRWSLWKTTNGGVNWDSTGLKLNQIGNERGWMNGMFILGDQIWFNSDTSGIYYSSNSGANWSIQTTSISYTYANVWFNSPTIGMCSGRYMENHMAYTSDCGATWIPRHFPLMNHSFVTGIMGYGNYFWVCDINAPSQIHMTSNAGINWIIEFTEPPPVSHITKSRNGDIGWACTQSGSILKRTEPLSIAYYSCEIPKTFSLHQNYPNPFNPTTNIKFDIQRSTYVKMIVYNSLGKEVSVLVNEKLNAGSYQVNWDGSGYPSGVYFYTLITDGYIDTKKMLMVK